MSFLKQNANFGSKNAFQWWGVITYIFLGLMAGSLVMSAFIVYNYTFRTLEDAHTIVLLNTETLVNNVNMDSYNKAVRALDTKNKASNFSSNLRNIFILGQVETAPIPTSTTSTASSTAYGQNLPTP
jgi:hypothetical protein